MSKALLLALGLSKKKGGGEVSDTSKDDEDEHDDASGEVSDEMAEAAQGVLDAIKSDDAKSLAQAMQLFRLCAEED